MTSDKIKIDQWQLKDITLNQFIDLGFPFPTIKYNKTINPFYYEDYNTGRIGLQALPLNDTPADCLSI